VNTLQFGQKAKNVKTTVNINEIASAANQTDSAIALEKAQKLICTLQTRIMQYEKENKAKPSVSKGSAEPSTAAGIPQSTQYLQD
jgi:hypothetical protein